MLEQLKKDVCKANKDLVDMNLVILKWGNVSAIDRDNNLVAIKPSGVDYDKLEPEDIVIVDLKGKVVEGKLKPSSDTVSHLLLYEKFPIGSVIHTHSNFATAFSQAKEKVKCMGTTHSDNFRGDIPVTRDLTEDEIKDDYELNTAKIIVEYFEKEKLNPMEMSACLVASHAPFIWGRNIKEAIENAVVLERVAEMNLNAIKLNEKATSIAKHLSDKHYLRKHGKDAYYGQD